MKNDLQNLEQNIRSDLQFAEAKNAAIVTFNGACIFFSVGYFFNLEYGATKILFAIVLCLLGFGVIVSLISFTPLLNNKWVKKLFISKYDDNSASEVSDDDKVLRKELDEEQLDEGHSQLSESINILFFKEIAKFASHIDYYTKVSKIIDKDNTHSKLLCKLLCKQIYELSQVAVIKYGLFQVSLKATTLSILMIIITVIVA